MIYPRLRIVSLMCLMGCGCSSAPVHYYTLTPPVSAAGGPTGAVCCQIQLRRVRLSPGLDRPEITARRGEDQVTVLANEIWITPLADEIQGALKSEISIQLLRNGAIEPAARIRPAVVSVEVTRFESVPARYVLVSANWRIQSTEAPKSAALRCQASVQLAVESGVSPIVIGYQQAIVKIADQIALDLLDAEWITIQRCATE